MGKGIIAILLFIFTCQCQGEVWLNKYHKVNKVTIGEGVDAWQSNLAMCASWLLDMPVDKTQYLKNLDIWSKFKPNLSSINSTQSNHLENALGMFYSNSISIQDLDNFLTFGPVIVYGNSKYSLICGVEYKNKSDKFSAVYKVILEGQNNIVDIIWSDISGLCYTQPLPEEDALKGVTAYHFMNKPLNYRIQKNKIAVSFYSKKYEEKDRLKNEFETITFKRGASIFNQFCKGVAVIQGKLLYSPYSDNTYGPSWSTANEFNTIEDIVAKLKIIRDSIRVYAPGKTIDYLCISTHGFSKGLNETLGGIGLSKQNSNKFAQLLDEVLSDSAKVVLFACCTGCGGCCGEAIAGDPKTAACNQCSDASGSGSFGESFLAALNPADKPTKQRQVLGHYVAGHAYSISQWRLFKKGAESGMDVFTAASFHDLESKLLGGKSYSQIASVECQKNETAAAECFRGFINASLPLVPFSPPYYDAIDKNKIKQEVLTWYQNHLKQYDLKRDILPWLEAAGAKRT